MKKKLLQFGLLYMFSFTLNQFMYSGTEYQQRPADLPAYIANPDSSIWQPKLPKALLYQPKPKEVLEPVKKLNPVQLNRSFIEEMARIENPDGDPSVINQYGYMGKFQMGTAAFRDIGVKMNPHRWRQNPLPEAEQDDLFLQFCALNSLYLEKDIKKYSGRRIKGIRIHESNILAAAHGGIGRAHEFLASNGRIDMRDGNGTRISHYFRRFEHHTLDLSEVEKPTI